MHYGYGSATWKQDVQVCIYANTGYGAVKGGRYTKLERFLAKNQLQSNEIIEFGKL